MALGVLSNNELRQEKNMLRIYIEKVGEMVVIECEGRIVRSEDAFKLRNAINLQSDSRIIVLDLSEVSAIAGGGLGMLVFLERWSYDHDIKLKLFNPRLSVWNSLKHTNSMRAFDIATLDEMMALLALATLDETTALRPDSGEIERARASTFAA
jgi:anti-anti-sigma regulatory factor